LAPAAVEQVLLPEPPLPQVLTIPPSPPQWLLDALVHALVAVHVLFPPPVALEQVSAPVADWQVLLVEQVLIVALSAPHEFVELPEQ
jgi:hypothetical protein